MDISDTNLQKKPCVIRRKALVQAVREITGKPAVYVSGDGRSYAVEELLVDKDDTLDYSKLDGFI